MALAVGAQILAWFWVGHERLLRSVLVSEIAGAEPVDPERLAGPCGIVGSGLLAALSAEDLQSWRSSFPEGFAFGSRAEVLDQLGGDEGQLRQCVSFWVVEEWNTPIVGRVLFGWSSQRYNTKGWEAYALHGLGRWWSLGMRQVMM